MFRSPTGQTGMDAYQYEAAQIANAQRELDRRFRHLVDCVRAEDPELFANSSDWSLELRGEGHGAEQFAKYILNNKKYRRFAVIEKPSIEVGLETIQAYMPDNYEVTASTYRETQDGPVERCFVIAGADVAGWTLDDYVIPRLASGLYHAREIDRGYALAVFGWRS